MIKIGCLVAEEMLFEFFHEVAMVPKVTMYRNFHQNVIYVISALSLILL